MKQFLLYILFTLFFWTENGDLYAQIKNKTTAHMWRIYEDNDFINVRGHGTDEAYTNGTRIDYFYTKNETPSFIIDRLLSGAGGSSINIRGWGLTQLMYTPRDITTIKYQQKDYNYSGALFVTHSLYSYNQANKYSLQTELLIGVRGPAAFAMQTQRFIHGLINYQKPMGWQNQLRNKLILNINIAGEKQVISDGKFFEIVGGIKISAGTFVNNATLYPLIRIGNISPYFNGLLNQYYASCKPKNSIKVYLTVKPQVIFTATNTLLTDGNIKSNDLKGSNADNHKIEKSVYALDAGIVLSINRFSVSFTQNWTGALLHNSYKHEVGNISLYFSR